MERTDRNVALLALAGHTLFVLGTCPWLPDLMPTHIGIQDVDGTVMRPTGQVPRVWYLTLTCCVGLAVPLLVSWMFTAAKRLPARFAPERPDHAKAVLCRFGWLLAAGIAVFQSAFHALMWYSARGGTLSIPFLVGFITFFNVMFYGCLFRLIRSLRALR